MSVSAYDVNNREPDLFDVFDGLESRMADLSIYISRAEKVFRSMSSQTRKGRAGQELSSLIELMRGRHRMFQGELMRLRQAED